MDAVMGYKDGDCKIILTDYYQYLLHSGVLIQGSATFRELLDDMWVLDSSSRNIPGSNIRHKLVLVRNPQVDGQDDEIGYVFEPVKLNGRDLTLPNHVGMHGVRAGEGNEEMDRMVDAYQSVLGCFYSSPIDFGEHSCIQTMLAKAIYITDVAEYLQCVPMITAPIESAFLAIGQPFYLNIASSPGVWLVFAHRIKSLAIFKEALIHAVGKHRTRKMQEELQTMPSAIRDIVMEKAAVIYKQVKDVERKIAGYYPSQLKRLDEETGGSPKGKDPTARSSYGNDILTWMALSAFRHIHTSCILDGETSEAVDIGYGYMSAVSKGGDEYIPRASLHAFHKEFPMSLKGMGVIEYRVNEIKEQCRHYAEPLMVNYSQLNLALHRAGHFTCTEVTSTDYPWVRG